MAQRHKRETRETNHQPKKVQQDDREIHIQKQTEPGSGRKLLITCDAQKMIPTNTWKRPKLTREERKALQNCIKQEREHRLEPIHNTKALTWAGADGKIQRQIDYILINQRFGNSARLAQKIKGWKGYMQKSRHRNVVEMNICLKLMKN